MMLKKIIFRSTQSLDNQTFFGIDFDQKVNIIIGPKGGGKSTLFDLIAGIKQGIIYKNVVEALSQFNWKFEKAIKFNNEEITYQALQQYSSKDKEVHFSKRHDVIFQKDPIKENLHKLKEIESSKIKFAKEVIWSSTQVEKLIHFFESFHFGMKKLEFSIQKNINWNNIFEIKYLKKGLTETILKLNYDPIDYQNVLDKQIKMLEKFLISSKNYQNYNLDQFKNQNQILINIESKSLQNIFNKIDEIKFSITSLIKILEIENSKLKMIQQMVTWFKKAYVQIVEIMKQKSHFESGLKNFQIETQAYFKDFANLIINQKKMFQVLFNQTLNLNLNQKSEGDHFLAFELKGTFSLNDDSILKLLKKILYTPTKSVNDVSRWLEMIVKKGIKEFDDQKLKDELTKIISDQVVVLANGKNYETMSLGEKSIYGIEYKLNKSYGQTLFLDQPEDNLDNQTIANKVLNLINQRKEQVFIVTHNANLGILTNPCKIIVANLSIDNQPPYQNGLLLKNLNQESDGAKYLEGGTSNLEKRYKIIKGVNDEN